MLVLARFEGQKIIIGEGPDEIVITVNELCDWQGRRRVKLGIDAPHEVRIMRPDAIDKAAKRRATNHEERHGGDRDGSRLERHDRTGRLSGMAAGLGRDS